MARKSCRTPRRDRCRDCQTRLRIEPLEARLVLATIITVNSAGDEPDLVPDDGVCSSGYFNDDGDPVLDSPRICSFDGAISQANFDLHMDTIRFSIPGPISSRSFRLIITPVTIDGSTSPLGKMELIGLGESVGPLNSGISLGTGSDGSTIRGMVISGYDIGITVTTSGNTIAGNYIGTNLDGTVALGNLTAGINIFFGTDNTIGGVTEADRNVISGNREGILFFTASASGNKVQGNYIGTNADGTAALGNTVAGVRISHAPGNIIGGSEPGQGNVISGNGLIGNVDEPGGPLGGVVIEGVGSANNVVTGNLIGTDKTGNTALGNRSGVWINGAPTTTVKDNVISGSVRRADFLFGTGVTIVNPLAAGSVVKGNKIGTNLAGDAGLGNGSDGVHVQDSGGNFIGGPMAEDRNIISGNVGDGVWVGGFSAATPAVGNVIQGNYIGTNAAGTGALPNDASGVHISSYTNMTMLGGYSASAGNLISGNGTDGVFLPTGTSNGNMIHSNLIGTDYTGLAPIPNQGSGINIWGGRNNIIGGTDANPSSGNTISSNQQNGVYIHEWLASGPFPLSRADGNVLRANNIGVGLDGATPLGNSADGVRIEDAQDNLIGGPGVNPFQGNIISANSVGVMVTGQMATGNRLERNFIGVDLEGNVSDPVTLLGNIDWGVKIKDAPDNMVGGVRVSDELLLGNLIGGNFLGGVLVTGETAIGNTIQENAIFANGGIGIDLDGGLGVEMGGDGVTPNGPNSGDESPNRLQGFPIITLIDDGDVNTIKLGGSLGGEPDQSYTIEIYATDISKGTKLEHGVQGQFLLKSIEVMTDETGFVRFQTVIPEARNTDEVYTATATSTAGDTSEFSPFTPDAVIGDQDIRTPVLFVPGIFGSFNADSTPYLEFLTNVGLDPEKLAVDPLARFYDDILKSLETAGYDPKLNLFAAPYDWRLPLGPSPTGQLLDGLIEIGKEKLADDNIEYGVDYLAYWLKKAADAWYAKYQQPLATVKIIAHSMGGLLTRTYVQSDAYGATFSSTAASRDLALPMISDLTMFGVPNQGASMSWNAWHNNFAVDMSSRLVLSKVINHAWQKLKKGKTINTPSGQIKLNSLQGGTEKERQLFFLRAYAPGTKDLIATYDDWGVTPSDPSIDLPDTRNRLVLDLNNDNTGNKIRFADRVARTMVLYGTNVVTASKVKQYTGELPGFQILDDEIVPFTDVFANDPEETEVWWKDLEEKENGEDYLGDGTVPIESLEGLFINGGIVDERVELHPFCTTEEANCGGPNIATPTGGKVSHTDLPGNADAQKLVLRALGHDLFLSEISTGSAIGTWGGIGQAIKSTYLSITLDPVEGYLVDGLGNRLGYTSAGGVKTEIPGSEWIGGADGMGLIMQEVTGPLEVQLTGLGSDYYVQVTAVLRDGTGVTTAGGLDSSGFLAVGETLTLSVTMPGLLGDLNHDDTVDRGDVALFVRNLGIASGATVDDGDLNGNGSVAIADLAILQTRLGTTIASSPQAPSQQAPSSKAFAPDSAIARIASSAPNDGATPLRTDTRRTTPLRDARLLRTKQQRSLLGEATDRALTLLAVDTTTARTERTMRRSHRVRRSVDVGSIRDQEFSFFRFLPVF